MDIINVVISFIVIALSAFFTLVGSVMLFRGVKSKNWEKTPAKLISSHIWSRLGSVYPGGALTITEYGASATFSYQYKGKKYTISTKTMGESYYREKSLALQDLENYKRDNIFLYVNPHKPTIALFDKGVKWWMLLLICIGLAGLAAGIGGLVFGLS